MTDPMTDRELAMLESVRRVDVPESVAAFAAASAKVVGANLLRASLANRLLDRLRETARLALRFYMEQLSLRYTNQRWDDGIEYAMWRAAHGARQTMTDDEASRLRDLSREAGGWFAVTTDSDEPRFVPTLDWQMQYDDWNDEENTR